MTTTYGSPFANPATAPQPSTLSEFPQSGVPIPMNLSTLTPGMAAIQAYRARGGVPLGRTMGGVAGALGAPSGATPAMLGAAQGAAADRSPMPAVQTQPSPYAGAQQAMGGLRPPSGYQTSRPGPVQTMGGLMRSGGGIASNVQGPPNAGGVRVGRIRPPNFRALNNRY